MRPGEMAAFPGPGAFFIHILCGCQMLQGSRHHSTWSDYVVQRPKTNKKICSLKSLIFIEGIMEKMTVFKSLCSVCQPGGGSGKVGWSGVDWLQRSWKSHPGQSPCDSSGSAGKTPSATIWQDLVTRAQSGQLSLTLEAEAGG